MREVPTQLQSIEVDADSLLYLQRHLELDSFPLVLGLYPRTFGDIQLDKAADADAVSFLRGVGLINEAGEVDEDLQSWLQVLHFPDAEIAVRVVREADGSDVMRTCIARRDKKVIAVLRWGEHITIQPIQRTADEIAAALWQVLGPAETVSFAGFGSTLQRFAAVQQRVGAGTLDLQSGFRSVGADPISAGVVAQALAGPYSTSEIVATVTVAGKVCTTPALAVLDTVAGRLLSAPRRDGREVEVSIRPGGERDFFESVSALLELTDESWFTHRR